MLIKITVQYKSIAHVARVRDTMQRELKNLGYRTTKGCSIQVIWMVTDSPKTVTWLQLKYPETAITCPCRSDLVQVGLH